MKKIIVVVLLTLVLLGSCQLVWEIQDAYTLNQYSGQKLYNPGFPEMETFEDVADYVESVLDYDYDMDWGDPILDPEEAIKEGRGICVTYAILFMNVAHFTLGIDFDLASSDAPHSRTVLEGGFPNHANVMLNGQIYSAYSGKPIMDYEAGYYYTFSQILTGIK